MMTLFNSMSVDFASVERRTVQVHGAAYAAFLAAAEFFGKLPKHEVEAFTSFVKAKCMDTSAEADTAVNVNQVWQAIISAARRGVFGDTKNEMRRFFKVQEEVMEHPPGCDERDENGNYLQGPWRSYTLFIEMNSVMDLLNRDFRTQGKAMALGIADLREQMSRREYWSARNHGTNRVKQRFVGSKSPMGCWAFEVDKMGEFGYRKVSAEAFLESKKDRVAPGLPGIPAEIRDWMDPRKGDIFSIVDLVAKEAGDSSE